MAPGRTGKKNKQRKKKPKGPVEEAVLQRKKAVESMRRQAVDEMFRFMDQMKTETKFRLGDFELRLKAVSKTIDAEKKKSVWKRMGRKKLKELEERKTELEKLVRNAKKALPEIESFISQAEKRKKAGEVADLFKKSCSAVDTVNPGPRETKPDIPGNPKEKFGEKFYNKFVNRYADALASEP